MLYLYPKIPYFNKNGVCTMYFYLAHRGRFWNPAETLVVYASIYNDYESGDHVTPSGTEDFDGLTVVSSIDALSLVEAMDRGRVAIYSNLSVKLVMERLGAVVWEGL